jgi:uncharacterized repeat protein (TIGR03803 family)
MKFEFIRARALSAPTAIRALAGVFARRPADEPMNARIGAAIAAFAVMTFAGCSGPFRSDLTPASGALLTPSLAPPGTGPLQSLRSQLAFGQYRSPRISKNLATETVLHSFGSGSDGASPLARLIDANGTLYSTTEYGGGTGCSGTCGTVFKITTSGAEKVLYSFAGGTDGAFPNAALANMGGTLYGTTPQGAGAGCMLHLGCGSVFKITKGTESVLHSFGGAGDGAVPYAGLTDLNGTLYGTTEFGGASGFGSVFTITAAGAEMVLYSFAGAPDGAYPVAGLTNVGGTLYGTTTNGGSTGCPASGGCGTVFAITQAGAYTPLHSFSGGTDGANPWGGLTNVSGTLYGTTRSGGADNLGTVFKITKAGKETVLHSFGSATDGAEPLAGMINVNGTLYGTTYQGAGTGCSGTGCGTVFKITTAGAETVIYSFAGGTDGAFPVAGLTYMNGTLYGTTSAGGTHGQGGTVYSLSGF